MNGLCEASERPERALTALHALLNYSHYGWLLWVVLVWYQSVQVEIQS